MPRLRLVDRLRADPDVPVAVVTAPAGYGKTTVLSQWDEGEERPFVWVALDQRHDDATLLLGAIAAALDRLEPLGDRVFAPLGVPHPNLWNAVVPRLCDALKTRTKPFVLVLDDLHRVHDRQALEPLGMIAEHLPLGSRLAIASRDEAPLSIGRLRTQRGVIELGPPDLTMSPPEVEQLLHGLGIRLTEENVERLLERTEGWPAGLYLAALILGSEGDPDAGIERFCGDDRLVADYLSEEFISNLGSDDRMFLTRAAILDRLSGSLCEAVVQRPASGELLKRLSRSNLLLAPLDSRDHEFRLHSLLREMLVAELHRSEPELEAELHRRASAWYAEHDDIERAIRHATATGEVEPAASLIWANTAAYESSGRDAVVRRWLSAFSERQIVESPPLAVARAASVGTGGDGAASEHWTSVALETLKDSERPDAEALRLAARVIRAAISARDGVVQMRRDVEQAYPMLPEDSPWRSLCCLIEGVSWHLTGDRDAARRRLDEGARRGLTGAPNVGMLCVAQLALVAIDEGDYDEGDRLADQAMDAAEHFGLGEDPTSSLAFAAAALSKARRGEAGEATRYLRTATTLLGGLNEFSAWYEAEARIVLARTLLLIDDVTAARARLAEAGRFLRRTSDATVLRGWIEVGWKDADAATVSARWPLSPAELRLLRYLPTHLSFREIGDELFVSANTVKTQARSIYRKLGVSSRAEAVSCAQAAGLLSADGKTQAPPA